jgi:hypothetical protein
MALSPTYCRHVMSAGRGDATKPRAHTTSSLSIRAALGGNWGDSCVHGWVNSGKDG